MKAMICRRWGGPEDLRLEEVESPALKPGQVRIQVRAAGVRFATTLIIAGKYQRRPPFPFAPGTEASGIVTEVDPACTRVKVGDEVVAVLEHFAPMWDELFPAEQARIVRLLVDRVDIGEDGADVRLRMDGLTGLVREIQARPEVGQRAA